MRVRKSFDFQTAATPQTRSELHQWVRNRMHLPAGQEQALLDAIDNVFMKHERLWQQSKQEAIQAVSAGFTDRMNRLRDELSARDATVSSIARYFEDLVADLTDRVHRDPKTRLMNFKRFIEQVEAFLALEQRGKWCAIGLVDINSFKWYNDPNPIRFVELGQMGVKFIFVTLGGQHAAGLGLSKLLASMAEKQEQGYIALQREEWAPQTDYPTRSHHFFSGVPYHHLVGKMYDASRLGQEFVEDLPAEKVV